MKHFNIVELCRSTVATKYRIENKPSIQEKKHLIELVDKLLDPLRESWGEYCKEHNLGSGAIKVTSGYRNARVNSLVGGVSTSAHMCGYAADIKPMNGHQEEFERWISEDFIKTGIMFDQIILERSRVSRWIHVGIRNRDGLQRKQCFMSSKNYGK